MQCKANKVLKRYYLGFPVLIDNRLHALKKETPFKITIKREIKEYVRQQKSLKH